MPTLPVFFRALCTLITLLLSTAQAATLGGTMKLISEDKPENVLFSGVVERSDTLETRSYFATTLSAKPGWDLSKPILTERHKIENGKVVRIELSLPTHPEEGYAELKNGKIEASYTQDGKTRRETLELEDGLLFGSQIVPHFFSKMDELLKGDTIRFRLLVLDRMETFGFSARIQDKTENRIKILMKPTSVILAMFVSPMIFEFNAEGGKPKDLIEVKGTIQPRVWKDGTWKIVTARTLVGR